MANLGAQLTQAQERYNKELLLNGTSVATQQQKLAQMPVKNTNDQYQMAQALDRFKTQSKQTNTNRASSPPLPAKHAHFTDAEEEKAASNKEQDPDSPAMQQKRRQSMLNQMMTNRKVKSVQKEIKLKEKQLKKLKRLDKRVDKYLERWEWIKSASVYMFAIGIGVILWPIAFFKVRNLEIDKILSKGRIEQTEEEIKELQTFAKNLRRGGLRKSTKEKKNVTKRLS